MVKNDKDILKPCVLKAGLLHKLRVKSRIRKIKRPNFYSVFFSKWSERQDLNLRPPPPQGGALPSCATSR